MTSEKPPIEFEIAIDHLLHEINSGELSTLDPETVGKVTYHAAYWLISSIRGDIDDGNIERLKEFLPIAEKTLADISKKMGAHRSPV
jgi:hypothetical protein